MYQDCGFRDPSMPLSYNIYPASYWNDVPEDQRISPDSTAKGQFVPECNKFVGSKAMKAYEYQTEELLTTYGLNIYDGAVWMVALSALGERNLVNNYKNNILASTRTCEWNSIEGDAPCKGIMSTGKCTEDCGFCYGSSGDTTMNSPHAWFFKSISEIYAFLGHLDKRCPEKGENFKWNSWTPILGENSWSRLTGVLQTVYLQADRNFAKINEKDLHIAMDYIASLKQMMVPSVGGILYAPYNTYNSETDEGMLISTENQASTLGGLMMLRDILIGKGINKNVLRDTETLIKGLQKYLKDSYDPQKGYFVHGGSYDYTKNNYTSDPHLFAVDCQTWTMSILGSKLIDSWFGQGTALNVWRKTKEIGGYGYNGTHVKGLGFDDNYIKPKNEQIFSGEWTLGAVNMLRIFANEDNGYDKNMLESEISYMLDSIDDELTVFHSINGKKVESVKYANRRYWIPFGWFANPIPSTASTGWYALIDANYNPLYLGGLYKTYDFI
eukprot:TRINITY_DN1935_c0_g1_i1.p1 TRINITY_DN1935_c0_g1~~TRINITY_DN1935_c0_g1_i1.p1  ORF type:complete len:540 (+),score=115.95 TRINITY_DN1935_c0_g1_i1:127-1620(+)